MANDEEVANIFDMEHPQAGHNTSIKVCHIVSTFPRREDDPQVPWMVEALRRIRTKGIVTQVFAPSYGGLQDQTLFGIPVRRFRYFPKPWEDLTHDEGAPNKIAGLRFKIASICYIVAGVFAAFRFFRHQRFDIIHVHWPFPHGLFGWIGAKVSGARMILHFYGAELLLVHRYSFVAPTLRWLIRRADAIVAISSFTAKTVRDLSGCDEITVIPYGWAVKEREGQRERRIEQGSGGAEGQERQGDKETRRRGREEEGMKLILFVGRLIERKGVDYLIRACGLLKRQGIRNIRLVIVGSGHRRPILEQIIAEEGVGDIVDLAGRVSDDDRLSYYRRCNIFVLPAIIDSRGDTEGLGVVLLEAMCYKKPVIASNVGGIPDIIRDGETGLLVLEKDPASLAAAIRRLIEDPDLAERLGENGYLYAREHFDWGVIVQQFINVYHQLHENPSNNLRRHS